MLDALRPIAEAHDATVARIALAWLLHQPVVTSVIIGASRPDQLVDNIAATELVLCDDELNAIDAASRLQPEYPAWMFETQGAYRREQLAGQRAPR